MANKSISMQKLRQLIRLHSQGKGTKAIAGFMSMSHTTVKKYLHRLKESEMKADQVAIGSFTGKGGQSCYQFTPTGIRAALTTLL